MRPRLSYQPHRAKELEREPVGPIGIAQFQKVAASRRPGVVDDNVDSAVRVRRRAHDSGRGFGDAQVSSHVHGDSASGGDLVCNAGQGLLIAGGENECGAVARKAKGDCAARCRGWRP